MAINFCNVAFGTKVTCSSVSTDGYEIENLLKPGRFGQMKGFLAEHFIKPPLSITFTLPFKIDICSIIIDPNVGSQKSSGIEIFSAMTPEANGVGKDVKSAPIIVSTNIGKGYCSNFVFPRLICFHNKRYRPLPKVTTQPPMYEEGTEGVLTRDIRCSSPACVRNVNQIVIKITRVHGASVPALKEVEIWGKPAASCDQLVVEKIMETVSQLQGLGVKNNEPSKEGQAATSKQAKKKGNPSTQRGKRILEKEVEPSDEIPEEFVDPITCNIMVIPILLPSGHTIDQETLEKHKKIEATWGRPPNDPFTGVQFSSVNKPIANVKLKARLDKFLLTRGNTLKDVPRTAADASDWDTVTDGKDTSKVKSSILIQPQQKNSGPRTKSHSSNSQLQNEPAKPNVGNDTKKHEGKRKRKTEPEETLYVNEQYARIAAKRSKAYGVHLDEDLAWNEGSNMAIKKDLGSHERAVSNSLDDALASTLASLPSYSKPSTAANATPQEACHDVCVNCTNSFKDSELNIYTMPCEHLICRNCTSTQTNGIDCRSCKKTFKTSELSRVHKRVNSTAIR